MSEMGRELGWDDSIQNENEFVLLPEGDYPFRVVKFDRGRHGGSEKLPACNKAILSIEIKAPEGSVAIQHNLFLHTKTEGMLSAFFCAIGQKKHGEKMTMNWNQVVGAMGRCTVSQDTWKGKDGAEMKSNRIKKFLEYEAPQGVQTAFTPTAEPMPFPQTQQPAPQQSYQQPALPNQNQYQPGRF